MEENLEPNDEIRSKKIDNTKKNNPQEIKKISQEKVINTIENNSKPVNNSTPKVDTKNLSNISDKTTNIPKKELPVEKKPFQEFINNHLIPSLVEEINQRGLEINNINLNNTNRPIAGDKCWVINCEIKDTCSFWLSFD